VQSYAADTAIRFVLAAMLEKKIAISSKPTERWSFTSIRRGDGASAEADCGHAIVLWGHIQMKILVIGAALATLVASPAFAQAYGPFGSGNLVFPPGASADGSPLVAPNATDHVATSESEQSSAHAEAPKPKHRHVKLKPKPAPQQ
jgi:hypothetical protein